MYGHDHIRTRGGKGLEERLGAGRHVPGHQNVTIVVQDTDVHATSMQIDPAGGFVLFGVKSPEILCKGTGHKQAAAVKLLQQALTTQEGA
jgi:hypothetical protein